MAKGSTYEKRLRELGCKPVKEAMSEGDYNLCISLSGGLLEALGLPHPYTNTSRQQRREFIARGLIPCFARYEGVLFITLDTGEDWTGPPELDIKKEFRFREVNETIEGMRSRMRQKMH